MNCRYFDLDDPAAYPKCELCGERTAEGDIAEMFDPRSAELPDGNHERVMCHPDCGFGRGLELA